MAEAVPDETLVIFHYHFLPGGVASVVRQALGALRAFLPGIGDIRLVAGRVSEEMRGAAARAQARVHELPAIDYYAPPGLSSRRVAAQASALAERLAAEFGGERRIWWVHNHHLGKNPVFTEALLRVLRDHPSQRAVLQIHDFPECGRTENLRLLRRTLQSDPYPSSPNVRYAVLTRRDQGVLLEAGLPPDAVHLLQNPVSPADPAPRDRALARRELMRGFPEREADLDPQRRLLFYPARTIRRKNVLEAMLLARLLDASLLVTLPGVSAPERRYSDRVAEAFADGLCRGLWGAGDSLHFEALPAASDLVLSTAVQEGFGYLFVNALQWGRPLAGRWLENVGELGALLEGYPAHLYEQLRFPVRRPEAAALRRAYQRKLHSLSWLYDTQTLERLRAGIPSLAAGDLAEFSYLSVPLQLRMLRALGKRLEEARQANAALLGALQGLTAAGATPRGQEVEARFGPRAFARAFESIIASFGGRAEAVAPPPVQQRIVHRFARLENLRLLQDF